MKIIKIILTTFIMLLAACKSTNSVAEKIIDICFIDSQKIFDNSSCFDPENSSCTIEFQEKTVKLIKKTAYEKHGLRDIWVTIKNGGVTIIEEFKFFGNAKLTELCDNYKRDSTKRNVECGDFNIISYSIDGQFNDEDLKHLADQLYVRCQKYVFATQQCSYIQKRQNSHEDDGIPDLNLEIDFFE